MLPGESERESMIDFKAHDKVNQSVFATFQDFESDRPPSH